MTKIIPPKIAFLNKMEENILRKTTILSGQFPQFDPDSPRQQIKREMRELEAEKQQKALPIPSVNFYAEKGNPKEEEEKKENARRRKRELIRRTLSEDYPGLDYLGIHNVLNARFRWYRVLWFSIVSICLLIGLFTIYRIIREYSENPTATSISVKSVEKLLLPQLTICATNAATVNLEKLEKELFGNNPRIGNYEAEDVPNFAYFMLAGSGFQKMNWKKLDGAQKERMNHFYDIFRQEQSVEHFFNEFFNNFGLDCRQFFEDCQLGDKKLDCCQVFEPIYLIRRGRCFRTIPFYQQNFDELGKLRVQLRHPHQMDPEMSTEREIIAFIAEHKPQIAPFPRYYLYPGIWTKIRLTAKRIRLLPGEEVCSDEFKETGKDFCYIEKWLRTYLEGPLNCTYPYMHKIRPTQLPSCQPITLFENYANAVETVNYTMQSCTLPCDRWEYTVSMEKINTEMVYKDANLSFVYRVDLSFSDLQFELIEEVGTVTFAGLISQIGGQMSLFMGSSILTLIQAIIMAVIIGHRILRANQRRQNAVGGEEGQNWERERHEMRMEGQIGQWKDGPKKYGIGSNRERAERGGGIGL